MVSPDMTDFMDAALAEARAAALRGEVPVGAVLVKDGAIVAAAGNRVIGDILQMRGSFESPELSGVAFQVVARVPVATSLDYPTRLGSLSGGRGVLSMSFAGYRECPLELGATSPRRGIDPRDQSKFIMAARKALQA